MMSAGRMRLACKAVLPGSCLLIIAGALSAGPWSTQTAGAKTVTTTCQDSSADAATLNAAIASSHPGDQILISGHCLLTSPITLLGDRSYLGGSRTGTVLQQASGANLPYLMQGVTTVVTGNDGGGPVSPG